MITLLLTYLAGFATAAATVVGWLIYQTILIDIEQNDEAQKSSPPDQGGDRAHRRPGDWLRGGPAPRDPRRAL